MRRDFIFLLIIPLLSCSKSGNNAPDPISNTPPSIPALVYPSNNLLCSDNTLAFNWEASTDNEDDIISYEIQIAEDNTFNNPIHSSTTNSTVKEISLEKGKAYYWRAKAVDSKSNASDHSEIFQFYTEGEGISNHLPFNPILITPVLGSTVSGGSLTLEWIASDVDSDPLTFNVYLGTDQNPDLVSEKQSDMSFSESSLANGTTYYWKVEVIDDKNAKSVGQVWSFRTEN